MGRRRWIGGSLIAVLFALAIALLVSSRTSTPNATADNRASRTVGPTVLDRRTTRQYLRGDGAALLEMHRTAATLPADVDPARCRSVVASLSARITGERAAALIPDVPDDFLRSAFDAERRALGLRLTGCVNGVARRRLVTEARALKRQSAVVEQRLVRLGVT